MSTRDTLYEFPISHFCEKARWALDHHGMRYDVVAIPPGLQGPRLKRLGVPGTTVPVWVNAGRAIQGSGAIIDALDAMHPGRSLTPANAADAAEARRLEAHFDQVFGDDLRRYAYALLLEHRDAVIAMWTTDAAWWVPLLYRVGWSKVSLGLRKLYRMRPERVEASRQAMLAGMDELDALVARGPYLVGDRLSRADIAACALLSPLVEPAQRPWRSPVAAPPELAAVQAELRERPFWRWVEERYRTDRGARVAP